MCFSRSIDVCAPPLPCVVRPSAAVLRCHCRVLRESLPCLVRLVSMIHTHTWKLNSSLRIAFALHCIAYQVHRWRHCMCSPCSTLHFFLLFPSITTTSLSRLFACATRFLSSFLFSRPSS